MTLASGGAPGWRRGGACREAPGRECPRPARRLAALPAAATSPKVLPEGSARTAAAHRPLVLEFDPDLAPARGSLHYRWECSTQDRFDGALIPT